MVIKQLSIKVHCPNCGAPAQKVCLEDNSTNQIIQTSCSHCDYLMISCARTGKVVEAYAPGLSCAGH